MVAGSGSSFLPAADWEVARPAVAEAMTAVVAAGAGSQFRPLLTMLGRFLADSVWDRVSVPDWTVLLTEESIGSVCAGWASRLSASTVAGYRGGLRRIAAAVHADAPRSAPRARWVPSTVSWWVARRWCGPFPALAAAFHTTGRVTHGTSLNGAVERIVDGAELTFTSSTSDGCPRVGMAGTVDGVKGSPVWLATAADVDVEVVLPDTSRTPEKSGNAPAKRPARAGKGGTSRMAELRRAARAAETAPTVAPSAALPDDVAASIADYRPKKLTAGQWDAVAVAARAAMTAFAPQTVRWVSTHGGYVVRFCVWVAGGAGLAAGQQLEPVALIAPGLVERYLAEGLDAPDSTRATVRWVLRRAVANLSTAPKPANLSHKGVQAPYTRAECAALVRLARRQPTDTKRREMSAAVALGLGAGLDSRDQRHVTRADISDVDLDGTAALAVRVRGTRPRLVVVRAAYTPLLREALDLHAAAGRGPDEVLHGRSPDRLNIVAAVAGAAVNASGQGVALSAARMRTTWLLAVMNTPLPLAALLAAAGLTTARTLVELLPYCPAPDPDDVAAILAHADDIADTQTGGEQR